ncbi:MAG: p-aminobenzoyl-glutamate transporter [Mycobacterium sp.]|nr:p-aminobenzoyl-glutamate transporter [Mycobacterium sp.]
MFATSVTEPSGRSRFTRYLDAVERVGNRLPHPFWLFGILGALVAATSAVLASNGVTVPDPATGEAVPVKNALSVDGIRELFVGTQDSFVTFAPLGTVLIIMLGLGVAIQSGLLEATVHRALARISARWVVFAVCMAGALSKFLEYSAYVVLIPLAAVAFKAVGRSPMLGMIVAFLSINAAGDANPFIAPGDVIFAGIATEAAQIIDPEAVVRATDNTYFTTVSAVVLAVVLTVVTEKILALREHELVPDDDAQGPAMAPELTGISVQTQTRALRLSGCVAVAYLVLIVALMVPSGSPLRGADGEVLDSPLFNGIAVVLSLFFFLIGLTYAVATRQVTRSSDLPEYMAEGVRSVAPLLVLFFAISQFLALFAWTEMSTIIAVHGADLLERLDAPIFVILMLLIVVVASLNLLVTSGTALWALVAPIVIPMMMLIGAHPATVMAVYRIADSCTNSITPMSSTFVLTVGFLQMYRKKAGIGTLLSFTLPAALAMLVAWTLLFAVWYGLGLPLGPGAPVR